MTIIPQYTVQARLILSRHDGVLSLDTWDSELTDYMPGIRPLREWLHEHMVISYTTKDLFDIFGLPGDHDVFEVVFEGDLSGWYEEWTGEWDESLDITDCRFQPVPDHVVKDYL